MRTSRFWRTIDVLPGAATDRPDWRRRLQDEWAHVERLLKPTGRAATQVDCPSPGGENCPRMVVRHPDGSIRAVCGEPGKPCGDLDLRSKDIAVFEFDSQKLAADLAVALSLGERGRTIRGFGVHRLGIHDVHAGRGFPVFLALDDPIARLTVQAFSDVAAAPQPNVVLTPTPETLQRDVADYLDGIGARRLALSDILIVGDDGKFTTAHPVETLFAGERATIAAGTGIEEGEPIWRLPTDAQWKELLISFISDEVINVTFRKKETRRYEPDQLGMKDGRNGDATRQWRLLRLSARLGGWLPKDPPPRMLQQMPEFKKGYRRQKELLGKSLIRCFGIRENPLPLVGGRFEAQFGTDAKGLLQGQEDQRDRNFADHFDTWTRKSNRL